MAEFKTKARAIDLLGENQISDIPTAVSELFKNAHDADATEAILNVDTMSGSLLLWDDGHGMDYDDVTDRWLTIGTDSKLGNRTEPVKLTESKKRVTMGEKGIGRLAISILGRQLLMVTKRKGKPWVLLFIHWGLFQNGRLLLKDTDIPVCPLTDIGSLEEVALRLRDEFKYNLTKSDPRIQEAWDVPHDQLKAEILSDLLTFRMHHKDLEEYLTRIDKKGQGTLFLVQGLKENWALMVSSEGARSSRSQRKRDGLERMMGHFGNPFFDTQPIEQNPPCSNEQEGVKDLSTAEDANPDGHEAPSFLPAIEIDGTPVENKYRFSSKDLSTYDYGLEGKIANGVFRGRFLVYGREPEVITQSLKSGIDFHEAKDCGPFSIKLCFVEGRPQNSYLPVDLWESITEKMDIVGGLYMFRDRFRVLPYGNQDVDIFHLERRRTARAGNWLLSMRRLFGYISISKQDNPFLKDKSNREGLRENDQYEFFHAVLDNLLAAWNEWIRDIRETVVPEAAEKRRAERERADLQAKLRRELGAYLKALQTNAQAAMDQAKSEGAAIRAEIRGLVPNPGSTTTYLDLLGQLQRLQGRFHQISQRIDSLGAFELQPSVKFESTPEVQATIQECTHIVRGVQGSLRRDLVAQVSHLGEHLRGQLDRYFSSLSVQVSLNEADLSQLKERVDQTILSVDQARRSAINRLNDRLAGKTDSYMRVLGRLRDSLQRQQEDILRTYSRLVTDGYAVGSFEGAELNNLFAAFSTIQSNSDLGDLFQKIQGKVQAIGDALVNANSRAEDLTQTALARHRSALLEALEASQNGQPLEEAWRTVDYLSQRNQELQLQIDQYRQLVSTGLAAEVANHEFEQQYKLMRRIFSRPQVREYVGKSKELQALEVLYTHLERQHNLLRPLFLRRNAEVKEINLYSVGESMREIFETAISTYGIKFINRIEESFVIRETEQTLWPVFINIINNAVFWLLDRKDRTILLRSDAATRRLFIEDSGPGISPDKAERVFELFYSTRPEGRGIGLNVVRGLLVSKKHSISVLTDPLEKDLPGAAFQISFAAD